MPPLSFGTFTCMCNSSVNATSKAFNLSLSVIATVFDTSIWLEHCYFSALNFGPIPFCWKVMFILSQKLQLQARWCKILLQGSQSQLHQNRMLLCLRRQHVWYALGIVKGMVLLAVLPQPISDPW